VLGHPTTISLTIVVRYEGSPYHQASFFIANFWLGPFLTTGHFLKDGSFSSIPPTYDQHTKPLAESTDVFG
jgi:hypothetical protein